MDACGFDRKLIYGFRRGVKLSNPKTDALLREACFGDHAKLLNFASLFAKRH
jgi:hypothetical protein